MSREILKKSKASEEKCLTLSADRDIIITHKKKETVMNSETMKAVREAAVTTLSKGADLAFKTTVVVLTLRLMGILQ